MGKPWDVWESDESVVLCVAVEREVATAGRRLAVCLVELPTGRVWLAGREPVLLGEDSAGRALCVSKSCPRGGGGCCPLGLRPSVSLGWHGDGFPDVRGPFIRVSSTR